MQNNMLYRERLEGLPGFQETLPRHLLNAYLEGELKLSERELVEAEIGRNEDFRLSYEKKLKEKEFIQKSIPYMVMPLKEKAALQQEISQVIKITLEEEPENLLKRVWRFLDTPII